MSCATQRAPQSSLDATLAVGLHCLDQQCDPFGIDIGRDAVPQVEHVSGARAEALEHAPGFGAQDLRRREQRRRIEIALQGDPAVHRRAAPPPDPWSSRRPTASQPIAAIFASQAPPPLVNTMFGTRRPSALRVSASTISAM